MGEKTGTSTGTPTFTDFSAAVISTKLHPPARDSLRELVNKLWTGVNEQIAAALRSPNPNTVNEEAYISAYAAWHQLAVLATTCDSDQRIPIMERWEAAQTRYAGDVKDVLTRQKEDMQLDAEAAGEEIVKLVALKEQFTKKWAELTAGGKVPNPAQLIELTSLQTQYAPLEEQEQKKASLDKRVAALEPAIEQLKQFIDLPTRRDKINHIIPGPKAILASIDAGTYEGLPKAPFLVLTTDRPLNPSAAFTPIPSTVPAVDAATIADVARTTFATEAVYPPLIDQLLEAKLAAEAYTIGATFNSGAWRRQLPDKFLFSATRLGNIARAMPDQFCLEVTSTTGGIEKEVTFYKFVRLDMTPKSPEEFIAKLMTLLNPLERGEVNEFYIKRALERIRADPRRGYNPFTIQQVAEECKVDGFIVDDMRVFGVNLGRKGDEYGVRKANNSMERGGPYEFMHVQVEEPYVTLIRDAVKSFGAAEFRDGEIRQKMSATHAGILVPNRVINTVITHQLEEFGLEQLTSGAYRTKNRPQSAAELAAQEKSEVDTGTLV